jgi:hypothetical protein
MQELRVWRYYVAVFDRYLIVERNLSARDETNRNFSSGRRHSCAWRTNYCELLLYPGDQNAIGGLLLYWPMFFAEKLGIGPNCGNANLIAEKLTCIKIAVLIDLLFYPLLIVGCSYMIHRILFRLGRTMRLPQVG